MSCKLWGGVPGGRGARGGLSPRPDTCGYKASGRAGHSTHPLPAPFGFAEVGREPWPPQPSLGPWGLCSRRPGRPCGLQTGRVCGAPGRRERLERPQAPGYGFRGGGAAPEVSSSGVREGVSWVCQPAVCGPREAVRVGLGVQLPPPPPILPSVSWIPRRTTLSGGPTWSLESLNQSSSLALIPLRSLSSWP